jgi:hypothetical protein
MNAAENFGSRLHFDRNAQTQSTKEFRKRCPILKSILHPQEQRIVE